jgi:glycosyltransferase involved in cell wall biosynthesis
MAKVLILETSGNLWGSERALLDLIDSAPGLDIAVCCPPRTPLQTELDRRGVRTYPYFIAELHRKSRWRRLQAALGMLRACLAFRPDVIHLNQSGAYRVALPAATIVGAPVVCHVRIFEDAAYLARQKPNPHRLGAIIAISDAVADEIRGHPALNAIPLHRIYDAYAPAPPTPSAERRRERIACIGRLTPIKGQEVLLAALAEGGFPAGTECLMAGDGEAPYVAQLKALERPGGVPVRWLGFVRDVGPVLAGAGVLACPSHREPLGRVIFEGWDAGAVPVVFAGAGGAAEAVSAADGGVIYREQTPAALADALRAAIALSDEEARRLVENGRAWIATNCALEPYGRAITAVFSALAKGAS